jgi:metal-sulfur cluster biosynthetic enzyme
MSEEQKEVANPIKWALHDTNPEMVENVRAKLSEVVDPEIGLNIIQLGLIRNVKIEDKNAVIRMILTTPFCPYGHEMIESTRLKAESSLERPVMIDLGMDVWDFSMMEEGSEPDWGMYY